MLPNKISVLLNHSKITELKQTNNNDRFPCAQSINSSIKTRGHTEKVQQHALKIGTYNNKWSKRNGKSLLPNNKLHPLTPECDNRLWFFHRADLTPRTHYLFKAPLPISWQRAANCRWHLRYTLVGFVVVAVFKYIIISDIWWLTYNLRRSSAVTQTVACLDTSSLQSESELSFITLIGNQPILSQHFFSFFNFLEKPKWCIYFIYLQVCVKFIYFTFLLELFCTVV